ncbi:MAG: hypothetical protein KKF44_06280 [Nanoarchaeota archaeon]|nr:hypothetical protein [Nanoarchaeota archaeon]
MKGPMTHNSMKRGIFFTIDAMFASIIIVLALVLALTFFVEQEDSSIQMNYHSQDIIDSLANIKISEINDSYVRSLIEKGNIPNQNNSIIEQIGEFYVLNQSELATNLTLIVTKKLVPEKFGFELLVNDETILINASQSGRQDDIISYRRMVSGFEKFKPLKGSTSKVFLEGINEKTFSSYLYFGGFVGQGNITGFIDNIPANASFTELYVEIDAGRDFELFINGDKCLGTFIAGSETMSADSWDISSCNSSLVPSAKNNFSISFFNNLDNAYLGGGFIRVTYLTNEMLFESDYDSHTYYFPEINGIINLYSSYYVPGSLDQMQVYIHYFANSSLNNSNNTLYLTVGNRTLLTLNNLTGEGNITLYHQNISAIISYADLYLKTVPIRMGFENVTFGLVFEGNADVVIITDVSGSMDDQMGSGSTGTSRNCDDLSYNLSTTTRLSVAKCLDKDFARNILNITGNKVGLVSYSTSTIDSDTIYPTTDLVGIDSTIGIASPESGYSASGYTCICCGINSAVSVLTENITRTEIIQSGADWLYTTDYFFGIPPIDSEGDAWYALSYENESDWSSGGTAILGATNSQIYSPIVVTEIGSDLGGTIMRYANLWEHYLDTSGAPNDFSSNILNSTANTFSISGGDDGWDWDSHDGTGTFSYDDDIDYNGVVNGRIEFDNNYGGSGNSCSGFDCSGGYGIAVEITSVLYNALQNGGIATVSFDYNWDDTGGNPFGSSDEVWIKAYWESPLTGIHYLGSEQSSQGGDLTLEIDSGDNPDNDISGTHSQEITSWIEGAGTYYLAVGGKLLAGDSGEYGWWRFDNIQLVITEPDPTTKYADFWEHMSDVSGPPLDFSGSTLNFTANTYGLGGSDDGWDWDSQDGTGQYGFDDNIDYNGVSGGKLELDNNDGGSGNSCSDYDCSGSYGIELDITQGMYDIMNANGMAILSFDYEWDDVSYNVFENDDQVWVKARWTSPTSGQIYLGENLDSGHDGSDTDNEVATTENPDNDFSGSYMEDISSSIEGPGNYYFEIGGKLLASSNGEYGWWRFDNIELKFTNKTNHYYFRKHFTISDTTQVGKGVMNVLSDDYAKVYINGAFVAATDYGLAEYWNMRGKNIAADAFKNGDNVIAVELINTDDAAKFDLELAILNSSKDFAMMVMSDGEANYECTPHQYSTSQAGSDAIAAACSAKEDYGITVYAVGYSDEAEESTLLSIAECGDGLFAKSDNITVLQEFYQDVASSIISTSRHSQTIEIEGEGDIQSSILYGDSYIAMNYTPVSEPPEFGEIAVIVEKSNFDNCSFNVTIPQDIRISDAKLTSYSAEHWTDELIVNGQLIYNLSDFNRDYTTLGDPFVINIPSSTLSSGGNSFSIRTGDSYENFTGCSHNNTFIYSALLKSSVSYSDVLENAEGCEWYIEFENGKNTTVYVPSDYLGTKHCDYKNPLPASYDKNDTYDDAVYRLLDFLDLDDNGRIFVDLEEKNFVIGALSVGKIPYPWGPAITEVRVWK